MSDMQAMLSNLYAGAPSVDTGGLQKTAEATLLGRLSDAGQVSENPYASMTDDELLKLASEHLGPGTAAPGTAALDSDPDLEKIARATLAGKTMAHACYQELGLIKVAGSNGICRGCKENPMDVPGSSICSACS